MMKCLKRTCAAGVLTVSVHSQTTAAAQALASLPQMFVQARLSARR
ncbi:hypothetical protein KCP78_17015 [Salmonella enterica subsp. enterica]|nr:hypothetical protein KCP78_17015 [Salmonella enterica subsp. enterica]